jgi:hypothetical protein
MCDYDIIFDIYKNSSDITDEVKIKHMPQLLGHFYNYLNSIILVYSDEISINEIKKRKTNLITNINIIIDFYSPIDIKIKESNFQINYLLIDLMTLAIIILYSYIYVIKNIKNVSLKIFMNKIITKGKKHYTIKELLQSTENETDIANDKFLRKMIIEILNKIDKDKKYEEEGIYDIFKYKIYTIDIMLLQPLLYEEIYTIINKFKIIYNIKSNEIITIVQYEGICWFTAFLTCICYSDANRKIFYDKVNQKAIEIIEKVYNEYKKDLDYLIKDNNEYRELIIVKYIINPAIYYGEIVGTLTTDNPYIYSGNELFILFVYIIIKYISNERKKYTDYHVDILNIIYEIIKKYPINILHNLYIEYKENQCNNSDYKFFNYLLTVNQPTEKDDLHLFFGMRKIHYNFLNIFYKKLDINILFLILIDNKYYIILDNNIKDEPEIILIQKVYDYDSDSDSDLKEYTMVHKLDLNYELDYILFSSDVFSSDENTSAGHAVCTITYNNEEYYYDSRYDTLKEQKFNYLKNLNTFYKPCPLIKQKWKNKNIGKFCLKECFYTKLNEKSKISRIIKNYTDHMCYNYENKYIACYVKKQPELSGGTNEKLTSTNTKINIIIDNKKIQRTVYINNNGIKVIKYNNKLIKIYNKYNK